MEFIVTDSLITGCELYNIVICICEVYYRKYKNVSAMRKTVYLAS